MAATTEADAVSVLPTRLEIDSLRLGQRVEGLLYLDRPLPGLARNNKWYVRFTCRDLHHSTIDGTLWDYCGDTPGAGVYRVLAAVEQYQGALQLKLLRPPAPVLEADPTPYRMAVTPQRAGADRLEASLVEALREIEDPSLCALLANVFDDETRRLFLTAPSAVQRHGCFPGGLAFHTLEVRRIALALALMDGGSSCDVDLLAAGALVHDIGKIEEMEYSTEQGQVVYRSDPPLGRLYGHMVCGVLRIYQEAFDLGLQDAPKVQQLIHLLVSHHGKPEWGAPVPPSTLEARLLHAADQCASEVEVTLDVLSLVNTRIDGEWVDGGNGRPRLYRGYRGVATC